MLKRACNDQQKCERKDEIIKVVNDMFDNMDYQEISMKTISEHISIARSSLYCYYNNKEEIMLDVLKEDYINWINDLSKALMKKQKEKELAESLANIYLSHIRLLKIISIYLTDIEMHASLQKLVDFKRNFVNLLPSLKEAIKFQFNSSSPTNIENFFNSLLMLTHSLYPMICPNKNQEKAMIEVGMTLVDDKRSYCYNYLLFIINSMNKKEL